MKISKYNFIIPFSQDQENKLIFNSRTGALAVLEKNHFIQYRNFEEKGEEIKDKEFLKNLEEGGYALKKDMEELDLIQYSILTSRFSTSSLALTIAPTLDCNFGCKYCYEKNSSNKKVMSAETQENLLGFIQSKIPGISRLDLTWYGGEPLMAMDVVENITRKAIDICEKSSIHVSVSVITNGYLLTRDVAKKLRDLHVDHIQVTLDGSAEKHNKRRPLLSGGKTYEDILKNLSESIDILENVVSIRVNVDKENNEDKEHLLDSLEKAGLKNRVGIYLGFVEPTNDCYQKSTCMSYNEYARETLEFNKTLVKKGFSKDISGYYPWKKSNYCCADSENAWVVCPDGDFYKCWSDIGIQKFRVGSLREIDAVDMRRHFEYLLYDATKDPSCSKCKYLPLCVGGCPRRKLDRLVDRCSEYKYILKDYLQYHAEELCRKTENCSSCKEQSSCCGCE